MIATAAALIDEARSGHQSLASGMRIFRRIPEPRRRLRCGAKKRFRAGQKAPILF
jgi:hypothetical protein